MSLLTNDAKGFLHFYSYQKSLEEWNQTERNAEKELRVFQLFKGDQYKRLKKTYELYQNNLKQFYADVEMHNREFLKSEVQKAYDLIGNVEGRKLDSQQMECIVKDSHSHLIIAGAGTGKTTTIIGKVKYLLATGKIQPQEFLILSFTNAAASEMKARLMAETDQKLYVATFHKLGYDIIRRADSITPKVSQISMPQFVRENLDVQICDPKYQSRLLNYLLYHRIPTKSEFSFQTEDEYREYLNLNPSTTFLGEEVKSYGEMHIANFLTEHGIKYQYEAEYPIDTRTEEYGQYYPDFFLPDHGIYIEYFGINRAGTVPAWFTAKEGKTPTETYQEGIKWKRNLHKENHTKLIECYAYESMEGILLQCLEGRLKAAGVELQELSMDEIFAAADQDKKKVFSGISELMATAISLCKSRRYGPEELIQLCISRMPEEKVLAELIEPVYRDYQKYLKANELVDFSDMLNRAADLTESRQFIHKFKYVIVDEYQDISAAQYRLLKAMRDQSDYELFCVGDDWQSIYRFAGSDIGYILHFQKYWDKTELSRIETTYRFSQRLIDISGTFIMQNPNQLKKYIRSGNASDEYALGEINGYTELNALQFMKEKLEQLPRNSNVFFLGRYNFDVEVLKKDNSFNLQFDNVRQVQRVSLKSRPDLVMTFYTAHRSKGLQADYVFIINNRSGQMGFPSKIQDPALIELLLENADQYPNAEERRLYYVALTRAKRRVYLVTFGRNISEFAKELEAAYQEDIKKEAWSCPLCGAPLRKILGPYGDFYGCSNYSSKGCQFKKTIGRKFTAHAKNI